MSLTQKPEIVTRPETDFLYMEKRGPFEETAPQAWKEIFPLTAGKIEQQKILSCMGLSIIKKDETGDDVMIYQAGFALKNQPSQVPEGTHYKKIPAGKFARFVLKGSYSQLPSAYPTIFEILAKEKLKLRPEFCIENYMNDASMTPENELLTELLFPIV